MESSQLTDNNFEPTHLDESDSQDKDKEEGAEEIPLPIPDRMAINSLTPSSEQDLNEQFSNNTRESLEIHLGTIIEETFQERSKTLEWPPQANLACEEQPRSPMTPPAQVNNRAEHRQNLLDGVADTRTKLLDCFFLLVYILLLLHFLTYIRKKGQSLYNKTIV